MVHHIHRWGYYRKATLAWLDTFEIFGRDQSHCPDIFVVTLASKNIAKRQYNCAEFSLQAPRIFLVSLNKALISNYLSPAWNKMGTGWIDGD